MRYKARTMFYTPSTPPERAESRTRSHLAPLPSLRYPSESVDARVWVLTSVCFFIGALVDLFFQRPISCFTNILVCVASIIPPLGLRVLHLRDRVVWLSAFGTFWAAQTIFLFQTGGIASPIFGGHTLLFLLILAGVFVRRPLRYIVSAGVIHIVGWAFLSYVFQLGLPSNLTSQQVITQNLLILVATVCTVLTIARTTERFVDECDRQRKSLTEVQDRLSHSERMAELGKLVATTAHELAQPLQVITTVSSIMRRASNEPALLGQVQHLSDQVNQATDRLSRVLGQLRNFSRKEPFVLRNFDLAEAIRSVETLSQYDLRWNGVACEVKLETHPLWTRGDSMRIQQVIFNLINNARDACGSTEKPMVRVTAKRYRNWVRVSVWNNGPAIPAHLQGKLFEPYFTTKGPDKGTGLGLTICEQLIEQHGGRILFSSQESDTCFVIDLPCALDVSCGVQATAKPVLAESIVS